MSKNNGWPAFPGNVAPKKAGVYIASMDTENHYGLFLGWFNGQYWYEYSRGSHNTNQAGVPRKKSARLPVTAWMEIDHSNFSDALRERSRAPTEYSDRILLERNK